MPFPGSVQGFVGWSSKQLGVLEGVPAHGKEFGTKLSVKSITTQAIL